MFFLSILPTLILAVMGTVEPLSSVSDRVALQVRAQPEARTSISQNDTGSQHQKRTSFTELYGPQYVDPAFADLHFASLNNYNLLVTACPGNNLGSAITAFTNINIYLITLFTKCRLAWYYNSFLARAYAGRFFIAIRELQVLLRLVSGYPSIMLGCRPIFQVTTTYLNYMIDDMRTAGVEFSSLKRHYSRVIDYGFFSYVGVTLGF